MTNKYYYDFPFGKMCIEIEAEQVTALYFDNPQQQPQHEPSQLAEAAAKQLREYFSGERKIFDLPLCPKGTAFQQKVWAALREIPYGETRSYGEIAKRIGNPKACRAVGNANNKNNILILIPCHRVIGSNGSLVGFGAGLDMKEKLLALENSF